MRAFALANITSPSIDFVIEILLKSAKDQTSAVMRKAALISLDILRKKAIDESGSGEPAITYLRARNLIPFFYRCLSDKDKTVR